MSGPSPVISASLDEEKYTAACELLGLADHPSIRIRKTNIRAGGHQSCYGTYTPSRNHVDVSLAMKQYDFEGLRFVMSELAITVLHELRHAWQHEQHGDGWYAKNVLEAERDAEDWARVHAVEFAAIIRVQRKFHGSGLSKLGRAEALVRQGV